MALTDELFESIDTIVKARISSLPYDQTIECEIIDISKAENGIYIVRSQASSIQALGEPSAYDLGDIVYVQIPQSDYKKDALILLKKNIEVSKIKIKNDPFSEIVRTDSNLFMSNYIYKDLIITTSADGKESIEQIPIIKFENPIAGYTKLALKFSVSSAIQKIMNTGAYGLILVLKGYNQKNTYTDSSIAILKQEIFGQNQEYSLISNKDMLGINLYNTLGFCNQQKVFDITNLVITEINAYLWQDGNFIAKDGSKIINSIIHFSNFQLYLGFDKNDFNGTQKFYPQIYTKDGIKYTASYNTKNIFLRLIELNEKNIIKIYEEKDKENNQLFSNFILNYYTNNNKDISIKESLKLDEISNITMEKDEPITMVSMTWQITIDRKTSNITSSPLVFKNTAYLKDEELIEYFNDNNQRIQNNFEKIIVALKKIDPTIKIDLE